MKFLRVLIFAFFAVFPAIRKDTWVPANKLTANIFAAKINLNSLHENTIPRNRVCSITTCLIHSETTKYWFIFLIACVAFPREVRLESWDKSKKKKRMTGEGEGNEPFFCFRSNLRAITRLETLATQTIFLKICISIARTQKKKKNRKYYKCSVLSTYWKSQKLIPSKKNQSVLIAKISCRKTQKIAKPQK